MAAVVVACVGRECAILAVAGPAKKVTGGAAKHHDLLVSPNFAARLGRVLFVLFTNVPPTASLAHTHRTRAGAFQDMTQRMDSENELITCDVHGRILTWDCDYRDPVQVPTFGLNRSQEMIEKRWQRRQQRI